MKVFFGALWDTMTYQRNSLESTKTHMIGWTCKVLHGGGLSESFTVNTGVKQGCLMVLFFVSTCYWLDHEGNKKRMAKWDPVELGGATRWYNLEFADDISLVSSNKQQNNAGQNSMANSYFQQARPASRWEQDQHNESQLYQQTTDQSHHLWGSNISCLPQGSVVSIERGFNEDIKIRKNKINFQHVKESMVLTRHRTEKQI